MSKINQQKKKKEKIFFESFFKTKKTRLNNFLLNYRLNDIVLIIDIAPTLLDIAGLKIPEHMDGISFMPYINRLTTLATSSTTNIITAREKNGNNHSNNNSNNGNTNENNHSELIKRDSFLIERG